MALREHFTRFADYNEWANRRLYADAATVTDAQYRKPLGLFFASLHGTLNHLLVADRVWMHRFDGAGERPARLDLILFEDFAALRAAREAEDRRIAAYVAGLSEDEIAAPMTFRTMAGDLVRQPRHEALTHFFNHQTHHRGQAHAALTILGIAEPASYDMILRQRELA